MNQKERYIVNQLAPLVGAEIVGYRLAPGDVYFPDPDPIPVLKLRHPDGRTQEIHFYQDEEGNGPGALWVWDEEEEAFIYYR